VSGRLLAQGFEVSGKQGIPNLLRPDYKTVVDISGGVNYSKPPDQLADRESPDMLNLVYLNKVLCVDFGFRKIGGPVFGTPQQVLEWTNNLGVTFDVLVTTQLAYTLNAGTQDWVPIPASASAAPTANGPVTGAGNNPSILFTGSATWTTGQNVAVLTSDGHYLVGPASGTTSPVTIGSPLPVGVNITGGASLIATQTLGGSQNFPITWVGDPIRNTLIFSNCKGPLMEFNGTTCVVLPGSPPFTVAGPIARFHNTLVVGGTVEGGVTRPYRVRRSATGDSTNWTTLDAGFDDLTDTNDGIVGMVLVNPYLAILRRKSIVRASYYGVGTQVLWYDYGLTGTGSLGSQSFCPTKTASVIVTESGVYIYGGDYGLTEISQNIFDGFLSYSGELNPAQEDAMFLQYVEILDETWIFYPDHQHTVPNTVWRYKHKTGTWFKRQFPAGFTFVGAGRFKPQAANRWIDLAGTRWIDRHKPWNARANLANYRSMMLCGADKQIYLYDFNTTTTDAGNVISWYFVSKDYPLPDNWETIDGLVFYGKGIVDLVEISTDFGRTYTVLGTNVVLGPTWARHDVDCSITTEFVRVRFSGTDPSFKLSWFSFKHMFASER